MGKGELACDTQSLYRRHCHIYIRNTCIEAYMYIMLFQIAETNWFTGVFLTSI